MHRFGLSLGSGLEDRDWNEDRVFFGSNVCLSVNSCMVMLEAHAMGLPKELSEPDHVK